MYCLYRQLLTIAVLRQNKTPLETDLKCSPVSTTHSHDIYQKINTFSQFAVSICCYANNAIQAQYTKDLCPNLVAASFEGCIQSLECNNGFHVSKAPSNADSNIYQISGHEGYSRWIFPDLDNPKIQCAMHTADERIIVERKCQILYF